MLFFNKTGEPLNFDYDSDNEIWRGAIHLPEVSINLFENETVYLVEQFQNAPSPTFNTLHGSPHIDQNASSTIVKAKYSVDSSEGFKLFTVDNPLNQQPIIDIVNELEINFIDEPTDTFDPTEERLITNNNINTVLRFDIAFSSEDEGVHEGVLIISDEIGVIVEIEVYTEAVGEDERFNVVLQNFGESIGEKEEFIFRKSDINEDLPNYKVLNPKRKEMLLEMHNIKPYFSGYRGIVNIIKYFGYFDLRLKEYWKNIENNHFTLEEVVLDEFSKLDKKNQLLEYPYQKTSNFGLFYDINRIVKEEFDELGLPITEDALLFSNEEIIIKLFGLKNYIKDRGIGGAAQIIDIVGEAFYFNRYDINVWTDRTMLQDVDLNIRPSFICDKEFGYIEDLRPFQNDYTICPLPRNEAVEDMSDVKAGNFPECFLGWFSPISEDKPNFQDEPLIPIGFPLTLTNTTFMLPWDMVDMTWNETLKAQMLVSWETISHLNFFEIEWVITKVSTEDDPREWEVRTRGTIDDLETISIVLPYDGFYDIALIVYGWNNEISKHTQKSKIEVRLREADFISFYRLLDGNLQNWFNNYLTWENVHSEWNAIIYENENFLIDKNSIHNRSFNIVNYVNTDDLGINNVGIKTPTWGDFKDDDSTWNDFKYVSWEHLVHRKERLARFGITKILADGIIQIGEDVVQLPNTINIHDFQAVAVFLASSVGVDIETFEYTARTVDNSKTKIFIDCVSKFRGIESDRFIGASNGTEVKLTDDIKSNKIVTWEDLKYHPWVDVPIYWENFESALITKSAENPFGWDNVIINDDNFKIPIMIPLFLVVDNSRMVGKSQVHWKITNMTTGEIVLDINSFTMVYRFVHSGRYTIDIVIIDTNGNVNQIIKKKHVEVCDTQEYENMLLVENVLSKKLQPVPTETVFFI